ncbi:protein IFH1-like isoform X2 [Takifugu rubripes]|uniref:protein IFH1-like isoform X2 n=1 Tax=Takifugu rubripes TaxID=31033 RepID=UPI0005D2CA51|nr:protein IFH1-like isoform X2 [Takifugu rubripes]|eukprot:XP_011620258.1 PREDICTED: protein IFH1-like isoform X2 [Takifugu rubripes]
MQLTLPAFCCHQFVMMEESFSDLLRDAFAGDLDFENLYSEEDSSTISSETIPTKEKQTLHQEAPSFCQPGIINTAENIEEEVPDEVGFQGEVIVSTGKSQEDYYTSSGEDSAQEGEDGEGGGEEMKSVKQLMWAHSGEGSHHGSKGDRPSAERRPLAPEGEKKTRVRNKEQGESESDEMSYFQRVHEHERTESDQQEPDSESEAAKCEEEEQDDDYDDESNYEREDNVPTLCCGWEDENPRWDNPVGDIMDFPELMVQQDLIAEDDYGKYVEKIKDFSGEEHQDAGESFAEYPSDLSSYESIEDGEKDEENNGQRTGDQATMQRVSHSEMLLVGSRGTEQGKAELVETMSGDKAELRLETSDSYSSSDDETQTTSDEEPNVTSKDLENKSQLEEHHSGSRMCVREDPKTGLFSDDLLVSDKEDMTLCPAEGVRMSSGSLDDRFFFSTEYPDSQISEEGELGDDEYEDKSNWEQEQERIRAFYEFYDDSDQLTGDEGRQTKVHFSTELFSQIIVYDTDSSDRGSLSSSTDGEEELSSAETPEEPKEPVERTAIKPRVPNTQAESESSLSQTQKRKQGCLNMLKVALKMGAMTAMGLLMFWWATDQAGWFKCLFSRAKL